MSDASQAIDDAIERSWENNRTVTCIELRDNILSALAAAGLAIVPVEPTEAMLAVIDPTIDAQYNGVKAEPDCTYVGTAVYQAMLRAVQETGT